MLTYPDGVCLVNMITGAKSPLPQQDWRLISTPSQAQLVLEFLNEIPGAKISLISATQQGWANNIALPTPNPNDYDEFLLVGTVPTVKADGTPGSGLNIQEYTGSLFDRGPLPNFGGAPDYYIDKNGTGPIGGSYLIYSEISSEFAQFSWSDSPQKPVITTT
jgi:hypothetical protein